MVIRLRLLGPIELQASDGRELRAVLAQPKRLALLAYVAAGARGFHRRDTLLALFWPELDQGHARTALNQAVRFLRKQLGDSSARVIVSRGAEELGADADRLWCDAVAFRELAEAGRQAEALELYRGDLLAGFFAEGGAGFEEWLERERAALRSIAARAARAVAEAREAEGNFTTAVASARRAVELADADERAVRALLGLLDRLGDRAGAIHAYEVFARRLAEDLGTEPDPETQALVLRIRGRAAPRVGVEAGAERGAVGGAMRMVAARESIASAAAGVTAASTAGAAAAPASPSGASLAVPLGERGSELGGWRIEREVGRGGMATVYLARDPKHDRLVALKVLRPELALSVGAERFLREIQIMARLAHPHILPLIDSGAASGALYLVAPYIAGESLRERLVREGRLGVEEALEIAREVASALDYAHRQGVVHRDIKPANVLLQDGRAVVADFGVALALGAAGGERVTATGLSPGTPSYMSPEQAAGDSAVDARSDVYSLGCVLYQMLAGAPPHTGPDVRATLARVMGEPARPVGLLREEVPAHVEGALARALAKAPGERFASAAEFGRALSGAPTAHGTIAGKGTRRVGAHVIGGWHRVRRAGALALAAFSLLTAVFVALRAFGAIPRESLLSRGLVEPQERVLITDFHVAGVDSTFGRPFGAAVRTALAQSRELTIVGPEAVAPALERMRRPRNALVDLSTARELALREGVRAIIDGHVVRTGRTFAVGLRLVAADSGNELVALQGIADDLDEVLPALDRLTRELRRRIGESLEGVRATPPLPQLTTRSLEALRLYDEHSRAADLSTGLSLLEAAVKADSEFAEAWRRIFVLRGNLRIRGPEQLAAITKAYQYSAKLPDLERTRIAAHYHSARGERAQAIDMFQRLLELGDSLHASINLAEHVVSRREFARAESLDRIGVRLGRGPVAPANLAGRLMDQGRLREAAAVLDSGFARAPNDWRLRWSRIRLLYLYDSLAAFERVLDSVRTLPDRALRRFATGQRRDLALLRGQLALWRRLGADARSLDSTAGVPIFPVNETWEQAQTDLYVRGDTAGAATRLQRAVERWMMGLRPADHPAGSPRGYLLWGAFLASAGHPNVAAKYRARYDSVIEPARRQLNEPWVHRLLAQVALARGRLPEALDEIRKGDMRPDGPVDECHICFLRSLGDAFDKAGVSDSATVMFERYVTTPFGNRLSEDALHLPRVLRRLGELQESRGNREQAIRYYSRFIELWENADPELQPRVAEARRRLARLQRPREKPAGWDDNGARPLSRLPDRFSYMPTLLRVGGYRFFFWSRENREPPHVHVDRAGRYAKFWIAPVALTEARGFRTDELGEIRRLVEEPREFFQERWGEHFRGQTPPRPA